MGHEEDAVKHAYEGEKSRVPWFNPVDTASNHLDEFEQLPMLMPKCHATADKVA